MPEIRPFRAWRYDAVRAGDIAALIAPPYDVISPAQQRELSERSPYNVIRLELTAAEPDDPPGEAGEVARHMRARATLDAWMAAGVLRMDNDPALYIYRQTFTFRGRTYTRQSILTAARLHPWSSGKILPHERTLAGPRAERLALLRAIRANISPIWSLYEDPGKRVAEAIALGLETHAEMHEAPELEAVDDDGTSHTLIAVTERHAVEIIRSLLAERSLFIADGHHRYETALAYRDQELTTGPHNTGPRDYVLMALTATDDPGLLVLPTHRLIRNLPAERLATLPEQLSKYFAVENLALPSDPAEIDALIQRVLPEPAAKSTHRFALLGPEPDALRLLEPLDLGAGDHPQAPALADLDVWLAHTLLLEHCLGIDAGGLEQQTYLTYTRDAAEAAAAVQDGTYQLALFLAPTPVAQLLAVARAGAVMPQKSTYFYPKPATGLVMRVFSDT